LTRGNGGAESFELHEMTGRGREKLSDVQH
jgi:hypothetical protein